MADRRVAGALLVGGASRRFGSPKALASFRGCTLAERAWAVLGEAFDEKMALGKAGELELPFPVEDDGMGVRAPLAGLVAGLRATDADIVVFLPVDLPLIEPGALRSLAEGAVGADAAVPRTGPLPGAYSRSALPVLERRLAAGELALRDALGELRTRIVELDPAILANVNEPEDLDRLSGDSGG